MGGEKEKEFNPPGLGNAIKFNTEKLQNSLWQMRETSDGRIIKFPGAVRGNKIDAYRKQHDRIDPAMKTLGEICEEKNGTVLFITLTHKYDKYTEEGCRRSWVEVLHRQKRWEANIEKLGMNDYFTALEAHALGGAHGHSVVVYPGQLKTFTEHKTKKVRIADEALRANIRKAWGIGEVDIRVTTIEYAKEYLTKEVGKQGHVENALQRARNNWQGEFWDRFKGKTRKEIDLKKNDCKKLFRQYYGKGRKLFRVSKSVKARQVEAERVHSQDDQLTVENVEKNDKAVRIPWHIVKKFWFTLKTGEVDQLTEEGRFLRELYEHEIKKKKAVSEALAKEMTEARVSA